MEPQIIDYYNEIPSGVNVIEKMNEELAQIQKENDILKKKLDIYKSKEEPPEVIYKDQEELDRIKEEAYSKFYSDLRGINLRQFGCGNGIFPHLNFAVERLLHKLLKDEDRKIYWPYCKAEDITIFIDNIIEPLTETNGYLNYDLIYDMIKNNIEKMFEPDECYGIVKFRCEKCNVLDDYLVDGECYECRFPDDY